MRLKKQRLRFRKQLLLLLGGLFFLIVGARVVYGILRPPVLPTSPRYSADVVASSTIAPSEEPVDSSFVSTAVGDEPALLAIPKIGVNAPIQKVGIDQRREVAVPSNIHIAGWFVDGMKPGEPGLSILDGHLDGVREKGVFWSLSNLAAGDTFTIERADERWLHFEVFAKKVVKVIDASSMLFSQDPTVISQLNLITCAGTYDKQTHSYDERVIVSARLTGI